MKTHTKQNPPKALFAIIICCAIVFANQNASAAFVDHIEHFDGNTKDTETWEEYKSDEQSIQFTQFGALLIRFSSGFSGVADYTTKSVMVGVGEAVSVEIYECLVAEDPGTLSYGWIIHAFTYIGIGYSALPAFATRSR